MTDALYGGDSYYRLCQEVILGIGEARMLRALSYQSIARFRMNEAAREFTDGGICLTSTHSWQVAKHSTERTSKRSEGSASLPHAPRCQQATTAYRWKWRCELIAMKDVFCFDNAWNLTYLALNLSHYVNGITKRHGEVSRLMFAGYEIDAITNGIHVPTWTSPVFQALFDRYIPNWARR